MLETGEMDVDVNHIKAKNDIKNMSKSLYSLKS